MGRAGRFGTKGLAITFVSSAGDSDVLNQVISHFKLLSFLFFCFFFQLFFHVDVRVYHFVFQVQSRFEVDIEELPEQIDTKINL